MLNKIVKGITKSRDEQRRAELLRKLMRKEAEIGGQLFGPVAKGGRREFFCLDEHTWVWHEEWVDKQAVRQVKTTRYDVRPDRILKSQNGHYSHVEKDEVIRLHEAAKIYRDRVREEVYSGV